MTTLHTAVSLDLIISASAGLVAIVGVYIRLKSKIDILETTCAAQAKDILSLQEEEKIIKTELVDVRREASQGHNKLETSMAQMELRIIREFQSVVTQILNQKDKP